MTTRMNRRISGMMKKRLDEAEFDQVPDGRDARGKRWKLSSVLRAVVGATLAGAQSLAQVEEITSHLSRPIRGLLRIKRRLPDTTLRNVLCTMDPDHVRRPLHALVRQAYRRKALEPHDLPFGMVSLDGKHLSVAGCDDWYAQRQSQQDSAHLVGVVRTVTATLTSHRARPIIDTVPIPAPTNEMGVFEAALDKLCEAYEGLNIFQLVSYDAGACSSRNAQVVRKHDLHYLFGLTRSQPTLFGEAQRWLGRRPSEEADASTEDLERGRRIVRRLYLGEVTADVDGWEHLRSVLRVETETFGPDGKSLERVNRYLISSLSRCRLSDQHWMVAARRHWGVETSHQILDTALAEDDHPWIQSHPRATVVVAILRRIAYTILTLFRSVTQRSDERRHVPWKKLLAEIWLAFVTMQPLPGAAPVLQPPHH